MKKRSRLDWKLLGLVFLVSIGVYLVGQYISLHPSSCVEKIVLDNKTERESGVKASDKLESLKEVNEVVGSGRVDMGKYLGALEDPREILKLLLKTRKINTSVHGSSKICLVEENKKDAVYSAKVVFSHIICTSQCTTEVNKFEFGFNAVTKDVWVD